MFVSRRWMVAGLCFAALLADSELSWAQPKPGYAPSSTHIFPAGARRGAEIPVRVGGECIPPGTRLWFAGRGVSGTGVLTKRALNNGEVSPRRPPTEVPITYPTEWAANVSVAGNAPLGAVHWRVSCAHGGSVLRPFIVGELPEFIESESNSTGDRAEVVEFPATINGQIHGERDNDYFRVTPEAGSVVVCDLMADRIASRLDPLVEVRDASGVLVECQRVFVGRDPVLAFRADGRAYTIRVSNVTEHGDPSYVYRMNVHARPYVFAAFSRAGRIGQRSEVELKVLSGDDEPETIREVVDYPSTVGSFELTELADGRQLAVPVRLVAVDHAVSSDTTHDVLPVTINGQLSTAPESRHRLHVAANVPLTIHWETAALDPSPLVTVAVEDAEGQQVALINAVDQGANAPLVLDWTPGQTGAATVVVRDLKSRTASEPPLEYRLAVTPATGGFRVETSLDSLNVIAGAESSIPLVVKRWGGFNGPVMIEVVGLPEGLSAAASELAAGTDKGAVTFSVTPESAVKGDIPISLVATANVNGRKVSMPVAVSHLGGVRLASAEADSIHLSILHKPIFRLYCAEAYQYAHRGSIHPYLMQVERLNGFEGPVTLQIGDRQNRDLDGIEMVEVTVPPGQSEVYLPIYLPETMHINVQSQSQLYSQAFAQFVDEAGNPQSVLVLSEKRNMIRTLPPVVKLKSQERVNGVAGGRVRCRLTLERTTNFFGAMDVVLLGDAGMRQGVELSDAKIPAGATAADVEVLVPASAEGEITLRFRATGKLYERTVVVSEAESILRIDAAAAAATASPE